MSQPTWIGYNLGGRYKIDALLGQGGMSAVYQAHDPNLRRTVAVKLIHAHLSADPEFVRRFEAEAAAVAQLRHPNIVQVFDFNHDGDTYYMVMEYLPGESLQARLRHLSSLKQRFSLPATIGIIAPIADAVAYAHERGTIHRDLKPANVMLMPREQPVLTDFGVAKILGGQHHTATGAIIGTPAYMSPEQVRGSALDGRADIYSLGIILYEMAAGRPPFEGDSAMTIMLKHVNEPVPDIRTR
ncbi:MAG: serine/threonine protein kinase, partial [Anaerolineales bacterium]|nr:serine/threonine protein kinase [Anaerolineales bacterium]